MRRLRGFAGPLALWLLAMAAGGWVVWRGQDGERDALVDRFQNRAETGSDFISAYVDDVFDSEARARDRRVRGERRRRPAPRRRLRPVRRQGQGSRPDRGRTDRA